MNLNVNNLTTIFVYIFWLLTFASLFQANSHSKRPSTKQTKIKLETRMSEEVDRAIAATKRRQPNDYNQEAPSSNFRKQKSKQRTHTLDVLRLNRLIKAIDSSWTLPKRTSKKESIGSNFQFKKTCASIYKARRNACKQLGFGVMCFNFCFEQGEELILQCDDLSDSYFCKSNSNFVELLEKYRKDAYRAKAYIHQMMSRCFATAICDSNALLNATSTIAGEFDRYDITSRPNYYGRGQNLFSLTSTESSTIMSNRWQKRIEPKLKPFMSLKSNVMLKYNTNEYDNPLSHENEIDYNAVDQSELEENNLEKITPKYVPFWQRLLVHKTISHPTTYAPKRSIHINSGKKTRRKLLTQYRNSESDESELDSQEVIPKSTVRLENSILKNKNVGSFETSSPPRTAAEAIHRRQHQLMALNSAILGQNKTFIQPNKMPSLPLDEKNYKNKSTKANNINLISLESNEKNLHLQEFNGRFVDSDGTNEVNNLPKVWTHASELQTSKFDQNNYAPSSSSFLEHIKSTTLKSILSKKTEIGIERYKNSRELPVPLQQLVSAFNRGITVKEGSSAVLKGTVVNFWNRFWPDEWFRSIQYLTNTG